jgi:hypothetical protein
MLGMAPAFPGQPTVDDTEFKKKVGWDSAAGGLRI